MFGMNIYLLPIFAYASNGGSDEIVWMHRLVQALAAYQSQKYQNCTDFVILFNVMRKQTKL